VCEIVSRSTIAETLNFVQKLPYTMAHYLEKSGFETCDYILFDIFCVDPRFQICDTFILILEVKLTCRT
jgi:hypothetical protein